MGEKHTIEYKSKWDNAWLEWICGFANADGGTLYIGINDAGEVVGLQNAKKLMEDIPNKIADKLRIYPDVRLVSREGKELIEIEVRPSQEAVTLDGVLYKRVGATNQIVKGSALREIYSQKLGSTWDTRIVPAATIEDINPEAIEYFLHSGVRKKRISLESIGDSPEKVLKNLRLMTPDGQLTIAALLLFGKDPQSCCLNARIKIGRFGDDQAALISHDLIEGDLIRMADRVVDILKSKYLIRPIHYEGMQRAEPLEIPEDGLREIIYNAIIHKDYNGVDSQMRVFDDKITFWNPGMLPAGYTPETIFQPHDSQPRNRLIANTFYMAGAIEAWGRGFEIISQAFTKENLEVPTLVEEFGGVRIIIKREVFRALQHGGRIDPMTGRLASDNDVTDNVTDDVIDKLSDRQKLILYLLGTCVTNGVTDNVTETTTTLARKTGVSRRTIVRDMEVLKAKGLVVRVGPDNGGYWKRLK
ncbi:MAG: putative DNA binding domain-containing protein [Bacteroidales bacterium]|nr:putative DNA binding domain-containing protein [Bacteroidales bacterium]